ncbi:hypothetical protein SAMN06272775_0074 [Streptomyces sp. 2323.1]|nr:hypothetical protein SAMN06272775_0074 [Streptomyces sp. 2323.1]
MKLCATGRPVQRTWTVELRPQHGGPVLVCPHCPPASRPRPLGTAGVRPAVVSHLASHALHDTLPAHLRTCQCHERGCQWHPRHRGCSGPIALVLTCERGGRLWRLADTCTACARATAHSATVPENTVATPPKLSRRQPRRRAMGTEAPVRVREMLSYLAAALPQEVDAAARLLATQCALRSTASGRLWIPAGLLRGMRINQNPHPWEELEQVGWLIRLPVDSPSAMRCGVLAQLLDAAVLAQAPGRLDRAQAADGAMRVTSHQALRGLPPPGQLAALALVVNLAPGSTNGVIEADRLGRVCALPPSFLASTLDRLVTTGAATSWSYDMRTEDITWTLRLALADRITKASCTHSSPALGAGEHSLAHATGMDG